MLETFLKLIISYFKINTLQGHYLSPCLSYFCFMDNKDSYIEESNIIRKFTIEELNVILGGIKERTIYYFILTIFKNEEVDESLKFLTDLGFPHLHYQDFVRMMFKKLADSFGITKLDKNLLLIYYPNIIKEVYRYFRNIEVDIDSVYKDNKDIYEFMEFFNNNPIIRDIQEKIAGVIENNGSIIDFSILNNEGIDELIVADNPKDFKKIFINIDVNNILFNYYYFKHEKIFHTWHYPFEGLKEKDPKNMILNNKALLLKDISFDVEANDETPGMDKLLIKRHYSFTKRYDIFNDKFEE